jgi:cytochrome c oxidase subunit 4
MDKYKRHNAKIGMRNQVLIFIVMILFTAISFVAVTVMSSHSVGLIIILLAIIQVVFQLYYFMHMKDKGHKFASLTILSGVFVALLVVAGLVLLT